MLFILFALFIFFCGVGHVLRALETPLHHVVFCVLSWITAMVSLTTALYLNFMVPKLTKWLDEAVGYMRLLNEETEASKRKMVTFMAFLCHEIRNPLFLITSNVTFLKDDLLTEDQRRTVAAIEQSTKLMLRLVNDVLDISRLEKGKIGLEETDFDLCDLFHVVALNVESEIRKRHCGAVKFCFQPSKELPNLARSDASRLLQIAYNLLSNATKFTTSGFIEFRVSIVAQSEALRKKLICDAHQKKRMAENRVESTQEKLLDDDVDDIEQQQQQSCTVEPAVTASDLYDVVVLKMEVTDTGTGIPADRMNRIFNPYTQCKLSDYRKHGGTGLGLAIVSILVETLGGTIKVESKVGKGSTFSVHIPIKIPKHTKSLLAKGEATAILNDCLNSSRLPQICEDAYHHTDTKGYSAGLPSSESIHDDPTHTPLKSPECTKHIVLPRRMLGNQLLREPHFHFKPKNNVVLVVDDNFVNRKLLSRMLTYYNLEVQQAEHGRQAVDIMKTSRNVTGDSTQTHFGLVIMDLSMPVMDGCEAIAYMRGTLNVKIPIVALTANATEWSQSDAVQAGATEVETKPILRDTLLELCIKYLPESTQPQPECDVSKARAA